MLRFFVPAEVDLPLESPATDVAGEWLEARVFAAVRNQVGRLTERLAADFALVGLLSWKHKGHNRHSRVKTGLLLKTTQHQTRPLVQYF